jgi:hypothetical protein
MFSQITEHSPFAVMELVGHDSEQMSTHNTHVGKDALKKAAARLHVL